MDKKINIGKLILILFLFSFIIGVPTARAVTFDQDTWCAIANCGSNWRNIWCVRGIIGNGYENATELGIMANAPGLCQQGSTPPDPCANPNPGQLRRASDIPPGCPGGPTVPPPNTTSCNGGTYSLDCPNGGHFYCPTDGSQGECIPADANLCNGKAWKPCPDGQVWSCESNGGTCFSPPVTFSEVDNYSDPNLKDVYNNCRKDFEKFFGSSRGTIDEAKAKYPYLGDQIDQACSDARSDDMEQVNKSLGDPESYPERSNYSSGLAKNAYRDMRQCLKYPDPKVNCYDAHILPLLAQAGGDSDIEAEIRQASSDATSDHEKLDPKTEPVEQPKTIEQPKVTPKKEPVTTPAETETAGPLAKKFAELTKDAVKPTVQKYYNQDGQEITLAQAKTSGILPYIDIVSKNPNLKAGDDFRIDLPPGTNLGDIIVTTSKDTVSGATTITAVVAVDTVKLLRGPNAEIDPKTNADIVGAINSIPSNYDPYAIYQIKGPINGEALVNWTPPISVSANDIAKTIPDYRMLYSQDGKTNWVELPKECTKKYGCYNDPSLNGYYSIVIKNLVTPEEPPISGGLTAIVLISSLVIWFLIGYFIWRALAKRRTGSKEDKWFIRHPVWGAIIIEFGSIFLLSFVFQSRQNFTIAILGAMIGSIGVLINRWRKKRSAK